jgi:hypothetical protein
MSFYEKKYLKYKLKYINQLGGLGYRLPVPIPSSELGKIIELITSKYVQYNLDPKRIEIDIIFNRNSNQEIISLIMPKGREYELIFGELIDKLIPKSTEITSKVLFSKAYENNRENNDFVIEYFEKLSLIELNIFLLETKSEDMNKSLIHFLVRKGNIHLLSYILDKIGPKLFSELMGLVDSEGRTPFMISTHPTDNIDEIFRIIFHHTSDEIKQSVDINGRNAMDWLIRRNNHVQDNFSNIIRILCSIFKDEKYNKICKR